MLNILVAYPYINPKILALLKQHENDIRFLLDSGAFTAFNAGKAISLDAYCKFLDDLPIVPWRYFMLDVIYNADKTHENLVTMVKRGYKPIPVVTMGSDLEIVEEFYKYSDVVACGGIAGKKNSRESRYFINQLMKKAAGRKVHLLGYSQPKWLKVFKPYSCDSTSWDRTGRYGQCDVYMGQGEYEAVRREQLIRKPSSQLVQAINRLGFSVESLTAKDQYRAGKNASKIAIRTWLNVAADFEKFNNTLIFFATGSANLPSVIEEYQYFKSL